ncbi:MAG: efflux RND transporter periplasmic adaptor subunit [Bacteroidales bacterium]|jgi:membrane fusion protein (multidrug efflux system)
MDKVFLTIVFIGSLLLFSCKQKQLPPPSPVPVNLLSVKAQQVVYYDRYTSTTVALNQVNLLSQVQGYITGIYFKEGSRVKKGDKLYEIDRRIYEGNFNAAAANLQVEEGNLKQAQQDADRYEYLNKNKAVAKQLYDHAIITLENAKNTYRSAEEALKNAKTNLIYSIISAPFDGTIGFSQVKTGDFLTPGQTVLNTVSSDDPMGVDFLINEKQLLYFENIQNGRVGSADSLFTLILPDNSFYSHTGKISVIDRAVNSQTGTIRIRLVFSNPQASLRPGMSCIVRVRNQDSSPQLLIPNKAVVEEMGEYFVYVAKDSVMGNSTAKAKGAPKLADVHSLFAFQKKVQTGVTIGSNVIIKKGIREGDKIVVDGVQSLRNGSQIATSQQHPEAHGAKDTGTRKSN